MPLLTKAPAYRGQSPKVKHRWFVADSARVKIMFGLTPTDKWPAVGMPQRVIDGITVSVYPLDPDRPKGRQARKPHRVIAVCPQCDQQVSLGRLGQHMAVHPEWTGE